MDSRKTLRELCNELDVSRRVIQGYEKAELVSSTGKNKYGHLIYDEMAQMRIAQIRLYQQFGFKLKEIKEIIDAPDYVIKEALENKILKLKEDKIQIDELIKRANELIDSIKY